jgi:hypothetical protein
VVTSYTVDDSDLSVDCISEFTVINTIIDYLSFVRGMYWVFLEVGTVFILLFKILETFRWFLPANNLFCLCIPHFVAFFSVSFSYLYLLLSLPLYFFLTPSTYWVLVTLPCCRRLTTLFSPNSTSHCFLEYLKFVSANTLEFSLAHFHCLKAILRLWNRQFPLAATFLNAALTILSQRKTLTKL